MSLNVSKYYYNRFLKERPNIQKAEETALAKQKDNQLECITKEKDTELNAQAITILERQKESESGKQTKQTKEMVRNKTIESIEYKMDLMENKINEILSFLNKGQGTNV